MANFSASAWRCRYAWRPAGPPALSHEPCDWPVLVASGSRYHVGGVLVVCGDYPLRLAACVYLAFGGCSYRLLVIFWDRCGWSWKQSACPLHGLGSRVASAAAGLLFCTIRLIVSTIRRSSSFIIAAHLLSQWTAISSIYLGDVLFLLVRLVCFPVRLYIPAWPMKTALFILGLLLAVQAQFIKHNAWKVNSCQQDS